MGRLDTADQVFLGTTRVAEVYIGTKRVWPLVPGQITGVRVIPAQRQITVSWNLNTQASQGYKIYRDGTLAYTAPAGTASWVDTGLSPSSAHTYRVSGVGLGGEGPQSSGVGGTVPALPAPTMRVTPSTTSAEVHFTTITFTLEVTANEVPGAYTLQRQIPNGPWTDVAAIAPNSPLGVANAIPAGNYPNGWFNTPFSGSFNFRVHFVGSGLDVYSPAVSVTGSYRARTETAELRTAADPGTPMFMSLGVYPLGARIEINIPLATIVLVSTATVTSENSQGYYATGRSSAILGWMRGELAQDGGGARGPLACYGSGADWMYCNETYQSLTPFGWRMIGNPGVDAPTWGVGFNSIVNIMLHLDYQDGKHADIMVAQLADFG
jgi:hypothetical protein